jgi:NAD-dependent dihydropyrimidine dehydrogenase PreA subunit
MVRASVINTLQYDPALCIGCGVCSIVCPHGVFAMNGRAARLVYPQACMECGACQLNCPTGAIAVESGVGCAAAMIRAALTGSREVTYGGEGESSCCGESTCSAESEPSCCGEDEPSCCCGG